MANKKPSKVSKKGASASNANSKYWSSYSIDKLIQQCKSRQIPVPTQKLKRQEYIDKIEDNLAKFADKGPRDWNKLTVEDLKHECNLRNVDITGLKKQGLLEKLGGGNTKDGGTEPTGSRQTGPPASNGQQNQDTSAGNTDKDYDNWDYRTRLLPAWKTLGIKSRKAVDIIQALKDRDQKGSSQGGPGAPASDSSPGTPEQPAGNASKPAASRSPPGQSGGQQGAAAGGTPDSPMVSIGSDFHKESAPPDPNRPVETAAEALEAARSGEFSQSHGVGLSNPSHLCYRNVMMVMLLHCNRLLSWIENRHIPDLEEAGFILKSQLDKEERKKDHGAYTDVWCELLEFAHVYWGGDGSDQAKVDKAMRRLWRYLTSRSRQIETGEAPTEFNCPFRDASKEHDMPQLLEWLIDLSVNQLASYLTLQGFEPLQREEILNRNVKELMTIYHSVHYPCQQRPNAMHRKAKLDEGQLLRVEMPPERRSGGRRRVQQSLTLQQCLEHSSSFEFDPCSCVPKSTRENSDDSSEAEQTPKPATSKIWYTPEVLFVQLKRFRVRTTASGTVRFDQRGNVLFEKDSRRVEIPTELDLGRFLNTKGHPDDLSAKYSLVGIVSHQGTRDGGHYVASICRGDDWREFDDSTVKKTTLKAVMEQKRRFTPYVIMYERVTEGREQDSATTGTTESSSDDNESNDAKGNAGGGPSARRDGHGQGAGNTKGANDADGAGNASNRGNKLGPAGNNINNTNNGRKIQGANNPAGDEGLLRSSSLFETPYVQKMLGRVFNKLEKHLRKEARDEAVALHQQMLEEDYPVIQAAHNRDASNRDVLMDHFLRREADMLELQQEQDRHIDNLVSYATLLENDRSELIDIVSHADPAALITFKRKRQHEEINDDDDDVGIGGSPPSKRSKRSDGHSPVIDVAGGYRRSIYDVHGSASHLQSGDDGLDDADAELPDYVTSDEEALEKTDSQSAPMSESDETETEYGDEDFDWERDEAATQAHIAAVALESYRANRRQMVLEDAHLARERSVAQRAFADDYAAEHNIVRGQGPWSWMGPQHQRHFEAQLQVFLDDWEERALNEVDRETAELASKFPGAGEAVGPTPSPGYSPRSPRYPSSFSDVATEIKVSPSRRFYSIGKDSNSAVAGPSVSPGGRSPGPSSARTAAIKTSTRSSRGRIPTTPPGPLRHDGHHRRTGVKPATPTTPAEQDTWYTPPRSRHRTPRSFNPRFHPGFGRMNLARDVWPGMTLEKPPGAAPPADPW
ncbi:hypothetical protein PV04_08287 [Phialophora macrospora]|uniref:ubiquitinyl hydrolase 1 n=1 Tax=Phialophora macrospora TaxID=1851006 RepID=A0A0D2DVD6_9EURO|nr:hypothetical protein PV04_08287 [Phialophora macrospora]